MIKILKKTSSYLFKLKQIIEIKTTKNLDLQHSVGRNIFKFSFLEGKVDTVGKMLRTKSHGDTLHKCNKNLTK